MYFISFMTNLSDVQHLTKLLQVFHNDMDIEGNEIEKVLLDKYCECDLKNVARVVAMRMFSRWKIALARRLRHFKGEHCLTDNRMRTPL